MVCFGIAEEGHYSVAEVLGDMASETSDSLSCRTMISGDGCVPILGVHLRGEHSRVNQVAEQDRQMTTLSA
jgi:hypothetical protein